MAEEEVNDPLGDLLNDPRIVWVDTSLCYRSRIRKGFDPRKGDVYYVGLLRYHYDAQTKQPLKSYFWVVDDSWVEYPIGGEYRPIEVADPYWPQGARDLLKLVSDSHARQALSNGIESIVRSNESPGPSEVEPQGRD